MTFGENPERECVRKDEVSITRERVKEICEGYADKIIESSGAQIVIALFSGAIHNNAHNSLGELTQEENLKELLPIVQKYLDDFGIPSEFYIGTLEAIARKLEAKNLLRG